jgi:hypothetical protein
MANSKHKHKKPQLSQVKSPVQPALQLQAADAAKVQAKPAAPAAAPAPIAAKTIAPVNAKPAAAVTPKTEVKPSAPVAQAKPVVKPAEKAPAPRLVSSAPAKPAAKPAAPVSASFKEEAKVTADAVTRSSKQVVSAGADALAEITSAFSAQAQKAQERASAIGIEAIEHASRSADAAVRQVNEALSLSQQSIEAYSQLAQTTSDTVAKVTEELFQFVNQSFARNVELSRNILSCRTVNDAVEWQNKLMQTNIDGVIEEISTLSDLLFDAAVSATEPLGERISKAVERFSKTIAA